MSISLQGLTALTGYCHKICASKPAEASIIHYQEVPNGSWSSMAFLDLTGRQWRRREVVCDQEKKMTVSTVFRRFEMNMEWFEWELKSKVDVEWDHKVTVSTPSELSHMSNFDSCLSNVSFVSRTSRHGWFEIYKHWWILHQDGFPLTLAASRTFLASWQNQPTCIFTSI